MQNSKVKMTEKNLKQGAFAKHQKFFGRGFTLIELLVVIAIISLLAVLVLFTIKDIKAKSRDARRVADIQSVQEGLSMYHNDNQFYPYPYASQEINGSDPVSVALISDGAMQGLPADPINGPIGAVTYKYYYTSDDGKDYFLEYYLETDSVQGKSSGLNTVVP